MTGNHEFYAGLERSVRLLQEAGFGVLRDRHVEVRPGLVLAGVDDLVTRQQFGLRNGALVTALAGRPAGATILLSHSPLLAEQAAELGDGADAVRAHPRRADLAVWPSVRLQFRLMGGLYDVGPMRVLVSRGTGTWGPRMRLWRPSEIVAGRRCDLPRVPADEGCNLEAACHPEPDDRGTAAQGACVPFCLLVPEVCHWVGGGS